MRITLHLLFPSDDSHMLLDSPRRTSARFKRARRVHKAKGRTGFRSESSYQQGRAWRGGGAKGTEEEEGGGAGVERIAVTRTRREKKPLVRAEKVCVFACRTLCERRREEEKKTETQSKKDADTKSQCVKPQAVHHCRLPGAIQSASEPRSRSSGPRGCRPWDKPTAELHPVFSPLEPPHPTPPPSPVRVEGS